MRKPLSEMTLEELWQLFPIRLTAPQNCWKMWYAEEASLLTTLLPGTVNVHHVGSTAIHGIWAKPIIDILVEACFADFETIKALLCANGYLCMAARERRMDFNKGYTPDGFAQRVFHLHLATHGDNDALYFRDYMNECPEAAKEYEALKLSLWKPFEHDRDGYTQSKTAFVQAYTDKAKTRYGKTG